MIKVSPYIDGDVFHVEPFEKEFDLKMQNIIALSGYAYTVKHDHKIIGVFGATEVNKGCFHMWSLLSEEIQKFPLATYKITSAFINSMLVHGRRIQMTTAMNNPRALRFAYRVGFSLECIMKQYGPDGQDHYLFAKVAA